MAAGARPAALAKGTEVRSRRAALKRAIREGKASGLTVLAGKSKRWEEVASDMPLEGLLLSIPGVGPTTVDELLDTRGIPADVRIYGLTLERRQELAKALERAVGG